MKKPLLLWLGLLLAGPLLTYAGSAPRESASHQAISNREASLARPTSQASDQPFGTSSKRLQKRIKKLFQKAEKSPGSKLGLTMVFIGVGFSLAGLLLLHVNPILAGIVAGGGLLLALIGVIIVGTSL